MKLRYLFVAMFLLIFVGITFTGMFVREIHRRTKGFVTEVIDGDTILLDNGDKVRLLGINTPEKGRFYYKEAKERLEQLVLNKNVTLEKDVTDVDTYGRLLRYVMVGENFVNLRLVKEGFAHAYVVNPDNRYLKRLLTLEADARKKGKGIWQDSPTNCVSIKEFHYDAEGDDNTNLNDEYVIFKNDCGYDLSLNGWYVKDEATHTYEFDDFTFEKDLTLTLFSGKGVNTQEAFYWNSGRAIWNNDGDSVFLRDGDGKLVDWATTRKFGATDLSSLIGWWFK